MNDNNVMNDNNDMNYNNYNNVPAISFANKKKHPPFQMDAFFVILVVLLFLDVEHSNTVELVNLEEFVGLAATLCCDA